MGVFSEATVNIEFEGETPEELIDFPTMLDQYVENEHGKGYGVEHYDFEWYRGGGITFKMSSPRLPNMEWQIDMVVETLKHHKIVPEEMTVDVMEQSDLTMWLDKESFELE